MTQHKLPPAIRRELDAVGLPLSVELSKGKAKLRLAGRLVGLVGLGTESAGHATKNLRAQIRRFAAQGAAA